MRIALTGCSGFIGSVTARKLFEHGHAVTGLVRPTSRRDHIEPYIDRVVVADQDDATAWDELLDDADCVIHNSVDWSPLKNNDLARHLRSNLDGSVGLLDAARPRQFIFVSSVAVHHDISPRWNGLVDEEHPLRPGNLYGAYKAAVEAFLWAAWHGQGQPTAAVRPCAVYGVDPNIERAIGYPIVTSIAEGKPYTRHGGGKFVHVDDVADALLAIVGNEETAGHAYHLADCYARWSDLAMMVRDELGVDVDVDCSSPSSSKNQFDKTAARSLGVNLDRGHGGLRDYVRELIDIVRSS